MASSIVERGSSRSAAVRAHCSMASQRPSTSTSTTRRHAIPRASERSWPRHRWASHGFRRWYPFHCGGRSGGLRPARCEIIAVLFKCAGHIAMESISETFEVLLADPAGMLAERKTRNGRDIDGVGKSLLTAHGIGDFGGGPGDQGLRLQTGKRRKPRQRQSGGSEECANSDESGSLGPDNNLQHQGVRSRFVPFLDHMRGVSPAGRVRNDTLQF